MKSLTLNPYVGFKREEGSIVAAMFSNRQQISLNFDPALEQLLKIADQYPFESWLEKLRIHFKISDEEFKEAITKLNELGILIPLEYLPDRDTVYARQDAFFVGMGMDGISIRGKLNEKVVMILGCGGIGGNLVEQLAVIGVSNFILVDDDVVELSNMNRSLIYQSEDVGKPKVNVLERWIESRNPLTNIKTHQQRIYRTEDVNKLLCQYNNVDLVIDCMDSPDKYTASIWVSSACWPLKIPHFICGGYHLHGGLVGQTCIPGLTACAMCYASKYQKDQFYGFRIPKIAGSFMPLVRLVSSLQCIEIIRILTQYQSPLYTDKTYNVDSSKMEFRSLVIDKNSECPICSVKGGAECES